MAENELKVGDIFENRDKRLIVKKIDGDWVHLFRFVDGRYDQEIVLNSVYVYEMKFIGNIVDVKGDGYV